MPADPTSAENTTIAIRMPVSMVEHLERYARGFALETGVAMTRSDAVRRLVFLGLGTSASPIQKTERPKALQQQRRRSVQHPEVTVPAPTTEVTAPTADRDREIAEIVGKQAGNYASNPFDDGGGK